jgi:hypothetical protein
VSQQPTPPRVQAAIAEFRQALKQTEGRDIDPLAAPWDDIEKGVIKLLGGSFSANNPAHQGVAFMVASSLAERLTRELGAFWFPHRGMMEGAALGFADALVVVSPLDVSLQALSRAKLGLMDKVMTDLRGALGQARLGGGGPAGLGPEDYQRLFDPGFVQFVCLDLEKAKPAWENAPEVEKRELEDAFKRLTGVPVELRDPMRQQILGALSQLEPGKPLGSHTAHASQLIELLALVHGAGEQTGFGAAELWHEVLLPLLHIGAPASFPPLDEEETQAFSQGVDPLLIFVESVPYQTPAVDEDGVLGVFPPEQLMLIDGAFRGVTTLRVVRAPVEPLAPLCARFDAAAVRSAVERFREHRIAEGGTEVKPPEPQAGAPRLLDVALSLLEDLCRVVNDVSAGKGVLCMRRSTQAEAASEAGLSELRKALQGPRIILA